MKWHWDSMQRGTRVNTGFQEGGVGEITQNCTPLYSLPPLLCLLLKIYLARHTIAEDFLHRIILANALFGKGAYKMAKVYKLQNCALHDVSFQDVPVPIKSCTYIAHRSKI